MFHQVVFLTSLPEKDSHLISSSSTFAAKFFSIWNISYSSKIAIFTQFFPIIKSYVTGFAMYLIYPPIADLRFATCVYDEGIRLPVLRLAPRILRTSKRSILLADLHIILLITQSAIVPQATIQTIHSNTPCSLHLVSPSNPSYLLYSTSLAIPSPSTTIS